MVNCATLSDIRASINTILGCGDNIAYMKQAVDCFYKVFQEYSDVSVLDQNDPNIYLDSGKAISPSQAAHCLLEMKRTAVFIRGINEAIKEKINTRPGQKVRILYAGTGPYAALVSPLLVLYSPTQVHIDLLEINPVSLQSAINVLNGLHLNDFVDNVFCADASTFITTNSYDIVISETMQAALKKEPQVAIMQNLIPQLSQHTVFIPKQIFVDAALISRGQCNQETGLMENLERIELGRVMTVYRLHLNSAQYLSTVLLAGAFGACKTLKMFTTIKVYGNHVLSENDCSLNIPYKLCDVFGMEGKILDFWYEQGKAPHILCRFQFSGKQFAALYQTKSSELNIHNPSIIHPN